MTDKKRKPYTMSEAALQQRREAAKKSRRRLKRIDFNTMPFKVCNTCFFFETVKAGYDIIVIKKKQGNDLISETKI